MRKHPASNSTRFRVALSLLTAVCSIICGGGGVVLGASLITGNETSTISHHHHRIPDKERQTDSKGGGAPRRSNVGTTEIPSPALPSSGDGSRAVRDHQTSSSNALDPLAATTTKRSSSSKGKNTNNIDGNIDNIDDNIKQDARPLAKDSPRGTGIIAAHTAAPTVTGRNDSGRAVEVKADGSAGEVSSIVSQKSSPPLSSSAASRSVASSSSSSALEDEESSKRGEIVDNALVEKRDVITADSDAMDGAGLPGVGVEEGKVRNSESHGTKVEVGGGEEVLPVNGPTGSEGTNGATHADDDKQHETTFDCDGDPPAGWEGACAWATACRNNDSHIPYEYLHYCKIQNASIALPLFLFWSFLLCYYAGTVADVFLTSSIVELVESWGMTEATAGCTLLAFCNSVGDTVMGYWACFSEEARMDLYIGDVVGATSFLILVVFGLVLFSANSSVAINGIGCARDMLFLFLSVVVLALFALPLPDLVKSFFSLHVDLPVGRTISGIYYIVPLALYVLYVLLVILQERILGHSTTTSMILCEKSQQGSQECASASSAVSSNKHELLDPLLSGSPTSSSSNHRHPPLSSSSSSSPQTHQQDRRSPQKLPGRVVTGGEQFVDNLTAGNEEDDDNDEGHHSPRFLKKSATGEMTDVGTRDDAKANPVIPRLDIGDRDELNVTSSSSGGDGGIVRSIPGRRFVISPPRNDTYLPHLHGNPEMRDHDDDEGPGLSMGSLGQALHREDSDEAFARGAQPCHATLDIYPGRGEPDEDVSSSLLSSPHEGRGVVVGGKTMSTATTVATTRTTTKPRKRQRPNLDKKGTGGNGAGQLHVPLAACTNSGKRLLSDVDRLSDPKLRKSVLHEVEQHPGQAIVRVSWSKMPAALKALSSCSSEDRDPMAVKSLAAPTQEDDDLKRFSYAAHKESLSSSDSVGGFWRKLVLVGDALSVVMLMPFMLIWKLSIPTPDFNPRVMALFPITISLTVILNHLYAVSWTVFFAVCIPALIVTSLMLRFPKVLAEPWHFNPFLYYIRLGVGVAMSLMWNVSFIAELIKAVKTIGLMLGIPSQVLGLTIVAWGNSVADLFANLAVARNGHGEMGLVGCFGASVFSSLFGIGSVGGLAALTGGRDGKEIPFIIGASTFMVIRTLILVLPIFLAIAVFSKFTFGKIHGGMTVSVYLATLAFVVWQCVASM